MATIITDKRQRNADDKTLARYALLNNAPPVNGFVLGNGPLVNQSQSYGNNELGKSIKRPITDFMLVRPMPKNGLHYYFLFPHCGNFPVYNDAFAYKYRFDHVNEDGAAVYLMPGSNV